MMIGGSRTFLISNEFEARCIGTTFSISLKDEYNLYKDLLPDSNLEMPSRTICTPLISCDSERNLTPVMWPLGLGAISL